MIRYSLLTLFILWISVYSFKDWFKALCMLIPLLAVLGRPDMPRDMFAIHGLNPYNFALIFVMFGYLLDEQKKDAAVSLPRPLSLLLWAYFAVFVISFTRMFFDLGGIYQMMDRLHAPYPTTGDLIIEHVINPLRFVIPGLLLGHGISSRNRVHWAIYSVLLMGTFLSIEIFSKMGPAIWGGQDLATRALRVLDRDLGYHRVAAATLLGMIVPAYLAVYMCSKGTWERLFVLTGIAVCAFGLALTGGRAGLAAGVLASAVLAFLKSKRVLIASVIVATLAIPLIPGLQTRLLQGFSREGTQTQNKDPTVDLVDNEEIDLDALTSDRAAVWPVVWEKIEQSPWVGYGKEAMQREGVTLSLSNVVGNGKVVFKHPHNAYLELLLDNGIIGATPVLLCFIVLGVSAKRDFAQAEDRDLVMVSGALLGFLIGFGASSIGSGSFYPQLRTVTMWCLMGLYLGIRYGPLTKQLESFQQESTPTTDRPIGLWSKTQGYSSRLAPAGKAIPRVPLT